MFTVPKNAFEILIYWIGRIASGNGWQKWQQKELLLIIRF